LIRQTLDAAQAFGLHRVELTVRENNVIAIALYKKFGFAVEGLQRKRILVEGVYENLVLMGLLF
jgi:RimJ/RimL family protein N-acetyltransferase